MTVDGSDSAPAAGQPRFQYGLRGLMVMMFAAAVGFSTVGTEHARWFYVPMGAAAGKMECPKCHKQIGTASKTCKECGEVIKEKTKRAKTPKPKAPDFADTIAILKDLAAFVDSCGGVESAKVWLEEAHALEAKCGGYEGLIAAIETTAELGTKKK